MKVLNVGGGPTRHIPSMYDGWDQDLLDIDPAVSPDIICDAKELFDLPGKTYDSVYCSHNLEHFYHHEVPRVLMGFRHILKDDGFVCVVVPDLSGLLRDIQGKDLHDNYYQSSAGPISFHDVIYGWGDRVSTGNEYYSHKTSFTPKSLRSALLMAGFPDLEITGDGGLNIQAIGYKKCR
jgi:SAM-dependent methyltransferase